MPQTATIASPSTSSHTALRKGHGPAFVDRFGREFLLGAPGWKKELLDDGGILYVVDESYMRWRTTPATEAIDYFRTKVPAIRQYRSRGFERTEAKLSGDPLPKRPRKKHK